jgi:hypothetical protein
MSFTVALLVVSLMSVGLAAFVRVRIGSSKVIEDQRGTLVIVPGDEAGLWLEQYAIEAGPFPSRWDPSADPSYIDLLELALSESGKANVAYEPKLEPIDFSGLESPLSAIETNDLLPPLPASELPLENAGPREGWIGVRVVRSASGPTLQVARLPLDAGKVGGSVGRKFLIEHDEHGRIVDVMALAPDDTPADLVGWLGRGRVVDHQGIAGSLVVESVILP